MNPADDKSSGSTGTLTGAADSGNDRTGLPWLRHWRTLYAFVLSVFVLWVVLLTLLSRIFS
ncbi:MAG TPA: hypothetical protein VMB80_09885 [Candidatus Acidoferrum sp.]|nr:hypothetical protein [Candidatus Acidoferrum sp.]